MSADRARIVKLINAAKRVEVVTLSPTDSDQQRQAVIRKMIDTSVRASDQRSVVLLAVEI